MKLRSIAAAAAAAFLLAPAAHAAVIYQFTGATGFPGSFQVTTPTFISADVTFAPSQLDNCVTLGFTCGDREFDVAPAFATLPFDRIGVGFDGGTSHFYFAPGSFGTPGVHATEPGLFNTAVLTITLQDGAVPEPATWAMLILGFAIVGGALRTRRGPRLDGSILDPQGRAS